MKISPAAPENGGPPGSGASARWQFLRGELDRQLAAFRRRRRRDKRKAFALQMATVTLSAIITVLLGLRTSDATRTWLLNIALVLGALITVLAAAEAFFTHRRLWVLRTNTVHSLETLSRRLNFHTAGMQGTPTDDVLGEYLTELDSVIAEDQRAWHHLRESPAADLAKGMSRDGGAKTTAPSSAGVSPLTESPRPPGPDLGGQPAADEPSAISPDGQ